MKLLRNTKIQTVWGPQEPSQKAFLQCPSHECLIHGNRGGGKTDSLLMDFLQHVGVGYGIDWVGSLFRQEYTQLTDVINKSLKWIPLMFPDAEYNATEHKWSFATGELLYLRYIRLVSDYLKYHGHSYPWLGFEELTNWATDECYLSLFSVNRSSNKSLPRKVRSTCNPSGPGAQWVKGRFIDFAKPYMVVRDPESGKTRTHISCYLDDNKILLDADPDYKNTIIAAVAGDENKYKAWVLGSWNVIVGGFFYTVWEPKIHVLRDFPVPSSWQVVRSFDWGSAKPWCVSYIAECNGEQPPEDVRKTFMLPYFPKGSAVVIDELYGWNGKPDEGDMAPSNVICDAIKKKDKQLNKEYGVKIISGPADTQIYEVRDGRSIASAMLKHGVYWRKAYKGSGSRIAGLDRIKTMLFNAKERNLESEHLYLKAKARHHIRVIPLMQHDEDNIEDIDSELEDHPIDSMRYNLTRKMSQMKRGKIGH